MLAGFLWAVVASTGAANGSKTTTLEQVVGCPEAFAKVPFDVDLLYGGASDVFNPFYSVFEPSVFANFKAWGAEAPIWERDAYSTPHRLFYVSRRRPEALRSMLSLKPMTWVRARCIVRSTFRDRAWIEVLSVVRTGSTVPSADFAHMVKGWVHSERGEYHQAMMELDEVQCDVAKMPRTFQARHMIEVGRAALGADEPELAMNALRAARKADSSLPAAQNLFTMASVYSKALKLGETAENPLTSTVSTMADEGMPSESETVTTQTTETTDVVETTEEWPEDANTVEITATDMTEDAATDKGDRPSATPRLPGARGRRGEAPVRTGTVGGAGRRSLRHAGARAPRLAEHRPPRRPHKNLPQQHLRNGPTRGRGAPCGQLHDLRPASARSCLRGHEGTPEYPCGRITH